MRYSVFYGFLKVIFFSATPYHPLAVDDEQRRGSVRTSPRVSINFAEGQYALSAGSVPTANAFKGHFTT